jgi:hypothetical protein
MHDGVAEHPPSSARWGQGNRFDLDKLIRKTENRDTDQCAWRVVVAETVRNFIPRRNEIMAIAGANIDRRLDNVTQRSAALFQRNPEVAERLPHLRRDVARSDYLSLIIERTRARSDDQAGLPSDSGVCVRDTGKQPITADKFNCHIADSVTVNRASPRSEHLPGCQKFSEIPGRQAGKDE